MAADMSNTNANLRTALILATIALAFFVGVIVKHWLFA